MENNKTEFIPNEQIENFVEGVKQSVLFVCDKMLQFSKQIHSEKHNN